METAVSPASVAALPLLERILATRGLHDPDELAEFLAPDYDRGLFSPLLFSQMGRAVTRLGQAIDSGEVIAIIGDYDVDGVSAAALLAAALEFAGAAAVTVLIPHRIEDGYGIMPESVERVAALGARLIVTVDNGITGIAAATRAAELGVDLIITDHHQPVGALPEALAIIDPWLPGEAYPYRHLAGVGLAFKLARALLAARNVPGYEAFLKWQLDLVALGTVADVAALVGENRVLVHFGLKVLAKTRLPGLRALMARAGVKAEDPPDGEAIGFRLAPRLNAAGRLGTADSALRLLRTRDEGEAALLADELEGLNRERQAMVQRAMEKAEVEVARALADGERLLLVAADDLHPGIVGLVAGKLSERHRLPAVVMTSFPDKDAYVASCRAMPPFDIAAMLTHFHDQFVKSGGHALAGGFTLEKARLAVFREGLLSWARALPHGEYGETPHVDTELFPEEVTSESCAALARLAPFGQGNPEPLLLLRDQALLECRTVGQDASHLRIVVQVEGKRVAGIGFSQGAAAARFKPGMRVDLVGHLRPNLWNGVVSPQLVLVELRPAGAPDGAACAPDGAAEAPDGVAEAPDGVAEAPDGVAEAPDGVAG